MISLDRRNLVPTNPNRVAAICDVQIVEWAVRSTWSTLYVKVKKGNVDELVSVCGEDV